MIKGCQKSIIHLRDTGCPYFEEAYFIVRRGSEIEAVGDDIVKEAMSIVRESAKNVKTSNLQKKRRQRDLLMRGASLASFLFGAIMLIYTLIV